MLKNRLELKLGTKTERNEKQARPLTVKKSQKWSYEACLRSADACGVFKVRDLQVSILIFNV